MTKTCATCVCFARMATGPNGECRRYPTVVVKNHGARCWEWAPTGEMVIVRHDPEGDVIVGTTGGEGTKIGAGRAVFVDEESE